MDSEIFNDKKLKKKVIKESLKKILGLGNLRLQMVLILMIAGGAGFLTSTLLLKAGLNIMAIRYFLAVMISYLAFLLSLRVWVKMILTNKAFIKEVERQEEQKKRDSEKNELLELYQSDVVDVVDYQIKQKRKKLDLAGLFSLDFDFDFEINLDSAKDSDDASRIIMIAAIVFIIFALFFIIIFPLFLFDLILQSLLMGFLFKKVKKLQQGQWDMNIVKETIRPFWVIGLILFIAGGAFQFYIPEVKSIGDVFLYVKDYFIH